MFGVLYNVCSLISLVSVIIHSKTSFLFLNVESGGYFESKLVIACLGES